MLFLVPDLQPLSIGKVGRGTQTVSFFLCLHRTERAGRTDGWMDGLHPDEFNGTWRFDCVLVKKFSGHVCSSPRCSALLAAFHSVLKVLSQI